MGIKVTPLPKTKKKKKKNKTKKKNESKVKRNPFSVPDLHKLPPAKRILGLTEDEYMRFKILSDERKEGLIRDELKGGRGSEKLYKKRSDDKKKKEAIKKANELNKGKLESDDKDMGITKRKTLPSRGSGWKADIAEVEVASGGMLKKNYANGGGVRKAKFMDS